MPRLGATSSCLAGKKTGILDSSEALHGLGQAGCGATSFFPEFGGNNTGCPASFPHALALGSTFNRSLWGLIGDQISFAGISAFDVKAITEFLQSGFVAATGSQQLTVFVTENCLGHTFADDVTTTKNSPTDTHSQLP